MSIMFETDKQAYDAPSWDGVTSWWADGHFVVADSHQEAIAECQAMYNHSPDECRPWTHKDSCDV